MAHHDSAPLTFARAAAVVGLGTSFGLQASLPLWSMAALYEVPTLAPRERLHLWSRHYTRGAYTVVPLNGISALLALYCGYAARAGPSYLPTTWVGHHRQAILATAGGLALSVIGFTGVAILGVVHKLQDIEKKVNKEPVAIANYQTDADIKTWTKLHLVRVALTGAAFTLAVTELALA